MISSPVGRYVAIGDSFTEGVGDPHKLLPNGVRGWADRVAEQLAKHQPGWEYANLAVRSKRMRHILADQLQPALDLEPTLVTLYAGGNDILDAGTKIADVMDQYENLVARLAETGATIVLFTGYDVPLSPAVHLFGRRNRLYNERVRMIAHKYGAVLIDYWAFEGFDDRRMWASDRLHMSKAGHKYVAARVLEALDVPHSIRLKSREPLGRRGPIDWGRSQRTWLNDWVLPLIGRKIRRVTLGDDLDPRWPTAVQVPARGGLRGLVKADAAARAATASKQFDDRHAAGRASEF